jgi:hypothetical protein
MRANYPAFAQIFVKPKAVIARVVPKELFEERFNSSDQN